MNSIRIDHFEQIFDDGCDKTSLGSSTLISFHIQGKAVASLNCIEQSRTFYTSSPLNTSQSLYSKHVRCCFSIYMLTYLSITF